MNFKSLTALSLAAAAVPSAAAGPLAYAVCQTGCNTLAVPCYAAACFTFGVSIVAAPFTFGVSIATAPLATMACSASLGTCTAACATVALFAPTP